jgi:hypothetical protein
LSIPPGTPCIYRVSQEERTIFWEVIVSVILSKKLYKNVCSIPNGFRDRAILVVWLGRQVLSFPPALLREGRSIFWEVIVSVILSKKTLYEHVSYSERFPRYSHLTSDIAQQGGRDGQYWDPKPNYYTVKWIYLGNRSD